MSGDGIAPRWTRWRDPALLVLAVVVVGLGAGVGAIVFRELIFGFTRLFTGQQDYTASPGAPLPWLPEAGRWFLLAVPVVGGLLYGPLVHRFAREARGHGVPEVMLAVAEGGGRIRPRVAVVKSLASALCIGSGGSVGREGPIVQIGSALGSSLGQWLRVPDSHLRLLVACGAAGGISATFNAPVAGVFFALELILLDFSVVPFVVIALASVLANAVARGVEGAHTFLALPTFGMGSAWELLVFAAVGVVGGLVGVLFTRTLYGAEYLVDRFWRGPEWLRPAVGGIALGAVLLALPQMYGVGYPVLERAVNGGYVAGFLVILLVGKLVATSLTLAIGGSGGVFAPSLFLGAMAGSLLASGLGAFGPGGPTGSVALVGMAAVLAGATRAPITAVVIVAEITGEWTLVLPLMIGVAAATIVSRQLQTETIYTEKLARRGIQLAPPGTPRWARRTVGDVLPEPTSSPPGLDGVGRARGSVRWSPVVEHHGGLGAAVDTVQRSGTALPVLGPDGSRLHALVGIPDLLHLGEPTDDGGEADEQHPRCVVELVGPAPSGWQPPRGFARLSGPEGTTLLVGPRRDLDRLVAGLTPLAGDEPGEIPEEDPADGTGDPRGDQRPPHVHRHHDEA